MNDYNISRTNSNLNKPKRKQYQIAPLTEVLDQLTSIVSFSDITFDDCKKQLTQILELMGAVDQSVIIGITDTAGRIIYANDMFCQITKYTREELIGRNHRILKSDYHDNLFFKNMWDTIVAGEKWEGEIKNKAKDGTHYWVKTTIVPILNNEGKPFMYISIRSEITEGKKAQEQLYSALQEEYRQTVSALDTIIFKVKKNTDGKMYFTLFAGKLAEKLDYSNEDFHHKTAEQVFDKKDADYLYQQFHLAFSNKKVNFKLHIKGKTLFISLSPIVLDDVVVEIVGNVSDITELEKAHETINDMAYHDVVTDLPNQRLFNNDLDKKFRKVQKRTEPFGILCLKINGFTKTNELLGHEVGEKLVCSISTTLKKVVQSFGVLYRSEGSRFLIITKTIESPDQLKDFAEIIQKEISKIQQIDNHEIRLTSNIGASAYPECGNDPQQLVKSAYIALNYSRYKAFCNYKYYTMEVHNYYQENELLEQALKHAIENHELSLHYQPKVDIKHNRIIGAEALIRWNSPQLGSVSPAKFIPLAEETGLIFALGEWVLQEACRQNMEWISMGYSPLKVAVNISPLELQHSMFIPKLQNILERTGLDPKYLEIEITENSIMNDQEESIEIIKKLRDLGVTVAIDDFGTGYSSLSYLKKFPVNSLKIDQCFIKDVMQTPSDAQLVIGMINIAHVFGLEVVAEGVETLEVADFLKSYHCEQVQGYYYSKPIPADRFEEKFLIMAHASL
ncbi:sensor domain-containing protein [Calidifontibacillus oryziterrae]|uniref:sensor domain-containing protein n=1 Tax=Calidifontibacillus oryziterrae TaxID=1191699 RepID=UPI00030076FA|nr:GGDEF domain-containing phosphodiesterase [Calidifontibacillus oryziterrae]